VVLVAQDAIAIVRYEMLSRKKRWIETETGTVSKSGGLVHHTE
jgi:hypothetical protein